MSAAPDGATRGAPARTAAAATDSFDGLAMRAWVDRAHGALSDARVSLDELNVFPVPDSDTGTNLLLTFTEGRAALGEVPFDAGLGDVAQAVAYGALMGARGNSGIILSQYLRALGETFADQADADGGQWAWALDRAALSASSAMAEPVEGTALTVVRAASDAGRRAAYLARGRDSTPVDLVVTAALDAARDALARTPSLLAPLAERGVVDAGGAGFVLLLQALVETVTGTSTDTPLALGAPPGAVSATGEEAATSILPFSLDDCAAPGHGTPEDVAHWQAGDFEVMYVLSASDEAADLLRGRLSKIGVSVGVVGGVSPGRAQGYWHVHVHTDDPVAAVAAARGAHLRQVCVRYLRSPETTASLGVVACTCAPGLLGPLASAGAVVVLADAAGGDGVRAGVARAIVDSGRPRVVVLPCGETSARASHAAAGALAVAGSPLSVDVLDSRGEAAVVAGVAALAESPGALGDGARLRDAVERTRTGSVSWRHPRDVIELTTAAVEVVTDLVRPADELLTVVVGREVPRGVVEAVAEAARALAPAIELIELDGGQADPALALGVE